MDQKLIKQAADALSIRAVFLHQSSLKLKEKFIPQFVENDDLMLVPQYRGGPIGECDLLTESGAGKKNKVTTVVFFFSAGIRLVDKRSLDTAGSAPDSEANDIYVEIEADFALHYRLKDEVDAGKLTKAFEEFGRFNIGYHAWPYWREYVQSTCARVGIPTIPVPMFQLPKSKKETRSMQPTKPADKKAS
jgi:hypothetical protein